MYWYELIGNFLGLPIENPDLECLADNDIFVLGIETSTWGCQNPKLFSFAELLATPAFCESVQDCIGDAIEWFDYSDALNQWLLNNPFPAVVSAANTTVAPSGNLSSTNVQSALVELQGDIDLLNTIAHVPVTMNDGATIDFTQSGVDNQTVTAEVIISALISSDAGNVIVLWTDGKLYYKDEHMFTTTFSTLGASNLTINHNINKPYYIVQVWDETTNELITVDVFNRTSNTIDIGVSTAWNYRIIILY